MLCRIKVLSQRLDSLIVRQVSSKIIQVESKLNNADKLKKLHYENKVLYGAKIKEKSKKRQLQEPVKSAEPRAEPRNDKDISSEIYWNCLHVPEVLDFTKPKKKTKISKGINKETNTAKSSSTGSDLRAKINALPQWKPHAKKPFASKVRDVDADGGAIQKIFNVALPLTKLQNYLPTMPSKTEGKAKKSDGKESPVDEREIPFESLQLRAIPNFPMFLSNEQVIDKFKNFVKKQPTIYFPSVSKVLSATMPEAQRNALIKWKNLQITELGLEGFEIMQKSHFDRGKQLHKCLQNHFQRETIDKSELQPEVRDIWKSIDPLLNKFQVPGVLIEDKIKHPYLLYQGIVDCVSYHNSNVCVIEWKKSDRQKKSIEWTYDAPIQLVSYLGALNASRQEFRDNPIKNGVVVVAYSDGQQADMFDLSEKELDHYWRLWVNRLQEYWVRFKDNTLPEPI